ncbi:MAG: CubicO group peptidase (beta-lactamase class C family) [Planctomycetota bacterium]|jgi:CubicO group peptidase (beta-lactamase class C family)
MKSGMKKCLLHVTGLFAFLFAAGCQSSPLELAPLESGGSLEAVELGPLRQILEGFAADGGYSGSVALVWQAGELRMLEAFGDVGPQSTESMGVDSIFRIFSMTKAITSVAALSFVEDGRLKLDDPVSNYIPEFAGAQVAEFDDEGKILRVREATREILISDLMSHTSGLTYGLFDTTELASRYVAAQVARSGESALQMSRRLAELPLAFDPGSAWLYSRSTDVLGAVLEVIDGQSLQLIFEERILRPLAMHDTAFYVPIEKLDRLAKLTSRKGNSRSLELWKLPVPAEAPMNCSGGGGLYSTARDYLRFCEMLIGEGTRDGVRILNADSVASLHQDRIEGLSRARMLGQRGFGLGLAVVTEESTGPLTGEVGSYHWSGYAGTSFFVDPAKDLIGIFMVQVRGDFSFMVAFRKGVYAALPLN